MAPMSLTDDPYADPQPSSDGGPTASPQIEQPAKVMRIGSMIKLLLEEVRQSELDEQSRDRLREIYETSITELSGALSPDLREELGRHGHPRLRVPGHGPRRGIRGRSRGRGPGRDVCREPRRRQRMGRLAAGGAG